MNGYSFKCEHLLYIVINVTNTIPLKKLRKTSFNRHILTTQGKVP